MNLQKKNFDLRYSYLLVDSFQFLVLLNLILKIISIDKISHFDLLFITILNILQPMAKWGIFGPSVQMLSLLHIVLPIYLSKKNDTLRFNSSLFFGVLFMYNRASFVSYIIYFTLGIEIQSRKKLSGHRHNNFFVNCPKQPWTPDTWIVFYLEYLTY